MGIYRPILHFLFYTKLKNCFLEQNRAIFFLDRCAGKKSSHQVGRFFPIPVKFCSSVNVNSELLVACNIYRNE